MELNGAVAAAVSSWAAAVWHNLHTMRWLDYWSDAAL